MNLLDRLQAWNTDSHWRRHARGACAVAVMAVLAVGCSRSDSTSARSPARSSKTLETSNLALPIQVYVARERSGDNVLYRYRITNQGKFLVKGVTVGYDFDADRAYLTLLPLGWTEETGTPASSVSSPLGWAFETTPSEEDSVGMISWTTHDDSKAIQAGQTRSGFEVLLPRADPGYDSGRWTAFVQGADRPYYSGSLAHETVTREAGASSGD